MRASSRSTIRRLGQKPDHTFRGSHRHSRGLAVAFRWFLKRRIRDANGRLSVDAGARYCVPLVSELRISESHRRGIRPGNGSSSGVWGPRSGQFCPTIWRFLVLQSVSQTNRGAGPWSTVCVPLVSTAADAMLASGYGRGRRPIGRVMPTFVSPAGTGVGT